MRLALTEGVHANHFIYQRGRGFIRGRGTEDLGTVHANVHTPVSANKQEGAGLLK